MMWNVEQQHRRLDIVMNDKLTAIFDELTKEDGITRAEIVRRAVSTYKVLKDQQRQNRKIELVDENNANRKEVILM